MATQADVRCSLERGSQSNVAKALDWFLLEYFLTVYFLQGKASKHTCVIKISFVKLCEGGSPLLVLVLCCFLLAKLAIIKFSLLQVLASLFSRRFLALEKLLFGAQIWAIEMCPSYHIALAVTFTDSFQVEISITFCLSNMIGLEVAPFCDSAPSRKSVKRTGLR